MTSPNRRWGAPSMTGAETARGDCAPKLRGGNRAAGPRVANQPRRVESMRIKPPELYMLGSIVARIRFGLFGEHRCLRLVSTFGKRLLGRQVTKPAIAYTRSSITRKRTGNPTFGVSGFEYPASSSGHTNPARRGV